MFKNGIKVISVIIALTMVMGVFAVLASAGNEQAGAPESVRIADAVPMDIDQQLKTTVPDFDTLYEPGVAAEPGAYVPGNIYNVNASAKYYTSVYGKAYYLDPPAKSSYMWFTKKAETNHTEVWVQNDTTFLAGDPRNADPWYWQVTDDQARYMALQFENQIYPNGTSFLGAPPAIDGENSLFKSLGRAYFGTNHTGRVMLMIFNIAGDENFFDPLYPTYIAGFYYGYFDSIWDRNIIHIDTNKWSSRVGPSPPGPDPKRPYLYESIVAHEYGHLLEAFYGPGEENFIDEGFSDFFPSMCGYPIDPGHIDAFLDTPDNSLTDWSDQGDLNILADYGAAALFMYYMNDQFGLSFVHALMVNQENGIAGVESTLQQTGHTGWTFDKLFNCWRLANLIHSDSPGKGLYNYKSFDLSDFGPLKVYNYDPGWSSWVSSAAEFFGNTTGYGGDLGVADVGSYGTDYINVQTGPSSPAVSGWASGLDPFELKLWFDGQDNKVFSWSWEIVAGPESNVWWSGMDDLADKNIGGLFDLRGLETATLSLDTYWDFEPGWDFGFVQVSTDGSTWTSLSNDYTTSDHDPGALPNIVANLPGLTDTSGEWLSMEFDLSAYVGQVVWIQFRYMADPNTHGEGWYIDNVALNGEIVDNADDVVYLANIPVVTDLNWFVTLYFPGSYINGVWYLPVVLNLNLNDVDETVLRTLTSYVGYNQMIILVSPNVGPGDYAFGVDNVWDWWV